MGYREVTSYCLSHRHQFKYLNNDWFGINWKYYYLPLISLDSPVVYPNFSLFHNDSSVVSNGCPKSYVQVTILAKLNPMCSIDRLLSFFWVRIDRLLKYSVNGKFTCWEHILHGSSLFCNSPKEAQIKSSWSRLRVCGSLYLIGLK